jgi:hypothetical protein
MLSSPALDRHVSRSRARLLSLLASLACVALLSGCADLHLLSESTPPPQPPGPPPTSGGSGTVTITPQYAAVAPGQAFQFKATSSNGGAIQWSVTGGGSVDQTGNYTAPASISQSTNVTVTAALASNPTKDYATAVVAIIQPGAIACPGLTGNPQVAQYTVYLPAPGKVSVEFGTNTSYGLNTWQLPTPPANGGASTGGQVQLWVAGMLGNTTYHMRGQVALNNGATFNDADQTCTTGTPPATSAVQVTSAGTPQPGIEMWNTVLPGNDTQVFASDLQGNVIWTYSYPHTVQDIVQGVQLLPNGNLLMVISFLSSLNFANASSLINEVREIDLAGNTVRSVTVADIDKKLAASTSLHDAQGVPYNFKSFHHDVLVLPNGHWVILADYAKGYTNLNGLPGNTAVLGDAIVDINFDSDPNGTPDWVWNSFDALANMCAPVGVCGVNRHPMNFPDWTHSNNMLYSTDDHNLLLSIRHQNWIVKIEYLDGTGSGKILWKLGYQGDFKLIGGTDPTDWFYAQHGMNYVTPDTTGVFRLVMMDNGNDRFFPTGQVICNPFKPPLPSGCYSTMPLLEINENTMTATLIKHYMPGPADFSYFGGNSEPLANGDFEVTFAATANGGLVQELNPGTLQPVWQATTQGASQYHVTRWQSLYPGIQW